MTRHFILLFILLSSHVYSQIHWEELPKHNDSQIQLLHISQEGDWIGFRPHPWKMVISKDEGLNWEIIPNCPISEPYMIQQIKENNNKVYFSDYYACFLTEFNLSTSEFRRITPDINSTTLITDFQILGNDTIVLGVQEAVYTIKDNGELIRKFNTKGYVRSIILRENESHVILTQEDLQGYYYQPTTNFSSLGSFRSLNYTITDDPIVIDDVIYFYHGVTKNLKDLQRYPNNIIFDIHKVNKIGNYLGADNDKVYFSKDTLKSFETYSISSFASPQNIHITKNHSFLLSRYACFQSSLHITNKGENFQNITDRVKLSDSYSFNTIVSPNGNVSIQECSGFNKVYNSNRGTWDTMLNANRGLCAPDRRPQYTFNNVIITSYGCRSFDHGQTWVEGVFSVPFYRTLYKNGVFYGRHSTYVLKSNNDGETWDTLSYPDLIPNTPFDMLPDERAIMMIADSIRARETRFVIADTFQSISYINIDYTQQDIPFIRAFHNSNTIYTIDKNDPSHLLMSFDEGQTFIKKSLPTTLPHYQIKSDFLDNIYYFNEDQIWMSESEGDVWTDITPDHPELVEIKNITLGLDYHLYINVIGPGVLKSSDMISLNNKLIVECYHDINHNCLRDSLEPGVANLRMEVGNSSIFTSDSLGHIIAQFSGDSTKVVPVVNSLIQEVCDSQYIIKYDSTLNCQSLQVPINVIDTCADLHYGLSVNRLRRCFNNTFVFQISNHGNQAVTPTVTIDVDTFFKYNSSNLPLLLDNDTNQIFQIPTLLPNASYRGKINYKLSCDSELGRWHCLSYTVNNDSICFPFDTMYNYCRQNTGSFDPNDKQSFSSERQPSLILPEDTEHHYLIRFQNTGTDTAFKVRIEDSLSAQLAASTFTPFSSSHDYTWTIKDHNLVVDFPNIQLPDSAIDKENSQGFFEFKIKAKEDALPGSVIHNTAQIFFDYNKPIQTNSTVNYFKCMHEDYMVFDTICKGDTLYGQFTTGQFIDTLTSNLGCDSVRTLNLEVLDKSNPKCQTVSDVHIAENKFNFTPNPFNHFIRIDVPNRIDLSVSIYSLDGKLRLSEKLIFPYSIIDTEYLKSGVYIAKIQLANREILHEQLIKL